MTADRLGAEPAPPGATAAPPPLPVERVAVVGLGLMGGSLARALKELAPGARVTGVTRSPGDGEAAVAAGAVDALLASPEGLADAELVVYAIPLSALLDVLPEHAPHLSGAVVTDVSSLKSPVVEAVRRHGLEGLFVGAHPMAGGEGSGFGASRPRLYRGASVHLTRDTGSPGTQERVETFWRALDAHPTWVDAAEHDRRMSWASHLPQLVSNALARVLDEAGLAPTDLGPGGRDMTRLAASSPTLWSDLVAHAAALDTEALRTVARTLEEMASAIESGRLDRIDELMKRTRRWRRGEPRP